MFFSVPTTTPVNSEAPDVAGKIANIVDDPIKHFDYDALLNAITDHVQMFDLDPNNSDVLEHAIVGLFTKGNEFPTSAKFFAERLDYAKSKIGFYITLTISEAVFNELIESINMKQANAAVKKSYADGRGSLFMEYAFVVEHVLPKIADLLSSKPDMLSKLQEQNATNLARAIRDSEAGKHYSIRVSM